MTKNDKMRMEMTAEGQTTVQLVDWDARTMNMHIPAQNMAMSMDISKAGAPPTTSIAECKPVVIGTEGRISYGEHYQALVNAGVL